MPRPKKIGGPEPKKRSRNGCWPCKAKKVKCGEEKPECLNCQRQGEACDYSIRLNWDGRTKRKADSGTPEPAGLTPHSRVSRVSGAITSTTAFPTSTVEDGPTELSPKGPEKHSNVIPGQPEGKDQDKELPTRQYVDSSPAVSQRQSTFQSTNHHASTTASPTKARTVGHEPAGHENARQKSGRANNPGNKEAEHSFSEERTRASLYTTYGGPFTLSPPLRKALGDGGIYPSPVISNHESPALDDRLTLKQSPKPQPASTAHMLPPYHMPVSNTRSLNRKDRDYTLSPQNTSKRIKLSPLIGSANAGQGFDNRAYDTSSRYQEQSKQTFAIPLPPRSPYGSNMGTPLTPASSSTTSEDVNQRLPLEGSPYISRGSPDLRRLSVHSLLSGPPEGDGPRTATHAEQFTTISPYPVRDYSTNTIDYGIDRGFPDLDVSRNDDMHALNGVSPALVNDDREFMAQNHFGNGYYVPTEFGFGLQAKNTAFGEGGYYAKPVPVKIPRSLEPLPPTLLQNPMNLLYFHHFLNHTARILVPHDCSENPFRKILPRMALENINLLNLLLAYSASHRARLLNQPEPANRIALWVQDVFPALRLALDDSKEKISNANLATAIMLASLEIISPNTFEVPVPWQNHLNTARRILIARGGAQSVHRQDKVSYFLSRWFAYLDVLGSLSGSNDRPLFSGNYWANDDADDENDFQIDCLLGFTSRCVSILAKVAELARQCDSERIDLNGNIRKAWKPSTDTVNAAEKLQRDLQEARTHVYKGCAHRHSQSSESEEGWDSLEMVATNDAFHWAGLVHLHRRVLGKPSSDSEVQNAVREIVGALYKVRKGGTAEACLLFPMFTAGCDAKDQGQREKIMERIRSVEGFGMTQVRKARTLMQKVWDTGKPWETLVAGEFFG